MNVTIINIGDELRPGTTISLADYFRVNFDPGFLPYCTRN